MEETKGVSKQSLGGLAKVRKMREAYFANPRYCDQCKEAILPAEGQSPRTVTQRVFCSRSCSNAFHNRETPKRVRFDRTCMVCSKTFKEGYVKRKMCDVCMEADAKRLEARTKGVVSRRNLYAHAATVMASNKREKKCQRYGYALFVEICHLRAVSDFPDTALLLEINAPENLIFLCPNCHHEFDFAHLVQPLSINK